MIYILGGIFAGMCIGWTFTFVIWIRAKGSVEWAWLLCKPFPLTQKNKDKLARFY